MAHTALPAAGDGLALVSTDWAARVLTEIDDASAITEASLARLVSIPSVVGTDAEHDIQALLAADLRAAGLDVDHWRLPLSDLLDAPDFPGVEVERGEAWGVVGRLAGRSPATGDARSLMLNAHVDVVPIGDPDAWSEPDPFSGRVVAGELHGRGACDMKAGLVAALAAVAAVRRAGVPLAADLTVACVQGEEDGGLGTYALLQRGWTADACVVPEPTSLDLVTACAGALTFRLLVPGRATHASRRTEGVSALDKLVPLLAALEQLEARRNRAVDPLMERWPIAYPLSIGTLRAGDWASSVPDLLVAEGRLGVALDEPVETARAALEETVEHVNAADPWLRDHPITVVWWGGQFASGRLDATSDLAARLTAAHLTATHPTATHPTAGHPTAAHPTAPATWGAPYGSDLRLLAGAGIPTLHYGPGDAVLAHAPDERVPLSELHTATRALALLALDLCGPDR